MAGNPSTLLPRPEPWGGGPPGSENLVSLGCHWVLPRKDGCALGSRLGESYPNNTCLLLLALSPAPRAAPGTQKALRKSLLTKCMHLTGTHTLQVSSIHIWHTAPWPLGTRQLGACPHECTSPEVPHRPAPIVSACMFTHPLATPPRAGMKPLAQDF